MCVLWLTGCLGLELPACSLANKHFQYMVEVLCLRRLPTLTFSRFVFMFSYLLSSYIVTMKRLGYSITCSFSTITLELQKGFTASVEVCSLQNTKMTGCYFFAGCL